MNIKEAIKEMESGKKMTHIFFTPDEFITMSENGIIRDESGYHLFDFWKHRTGDAWNTGWDYWEEQQIIDKN